MKSVSISRPNGWLRGSPGSSSWIGAPSLSAVRGGSSVLESRTQVLSDLPFLAVELTARGCEGAVGDDFAEAYGLVIFGGGLLVPQPQTNKGFSNGGYRQFPAGLVEDPPVGGYSFQFGSDNAFDVLSSGAGACVCGVHWCGSKWSLVYVPLDGIGTPSSNQLNCFQGTSHLR